MSLETVLAALHHNPGDHLGWLAIADCLEEQGETERAELARLSALVRLTDSETEGARMMTRLRELLASGVKPCVPTLSNSIGLEMALIPPGRFLMGSPETEEGRGDDEHQHEVEITRGFYLGIYPVTQEQYQRVMGRNPSHFNSEKMCQDTSRFPVERVSWDDARAFCEELNKLEKRSLNGQKYTLPTEAQWEYACRGPAAFKNSSPFHVGDSLSSTQANFNGNYPLGEAAKGPYLERPCDVGSYKPNAFGLHDMHGQVWEWCLDWYDEDYYKISPRENPPGPSDGSDRVLRGGGWNFSAGSCQAACRDRDDPAYSCDFLGLRLARVPSGEEEQGTSPGRSGG